MNTIFGVSLYSALVYFGTNIFVAQIVSHLCGMAFNYFTFTRHVFRDHKPNVMRYVVSYGFNYLVSLGTLAMIHYFVKSPYIAGIITTLIVSILNYFVLKFLVFSSRRV